MRRLMNVAALMCASLLDVFRITLRHGFAIRSLPDTHFLNDGNRLLLFTGAHACACRWGCQVWGIWYLAVPWPRFR